MLKMYFFTLFSGAYICEMITLRLQYYVNVVENQVAVRILLVPVATVSVIINICIYVR